MAKLSNTRARFRWNMCIENWGKHEAEDEGADPNPMATMPVISPFLSGNHLVTVLIGVT